MEQSVLLFSFFVIVLPLSCFVGAYLLGRAPKCKLCGGKTESWCDPDVQQRNKDRALAKAGLNLIGGALFGGIAGQAAGAVAGEAGESLFGEPEPNPLYWRCLKCGSLSAQRSAAPGCVLMVVGVLIIPVSGLLISEFF